MNHTPGFTAVVTAAGHATRFRPFSTIVPKEMLPLGTTPAVQHVVTECLDAGATQVIVVTRPDDTVIPAHLATLTACGLPVETMPEDTSHGYGNGAPLLTLRDRLAEEDSFAVAFGDDVLLDSPTPGADLATMRRLAHDGADAVIATQHVDPAETGSFGIIDVHEGQADRVAAIRQRPHPTTVNQPLAVVSRLILRPSIFDHLTATDLARGEVDLGIAVSKLASHADVRLHRITSCWVTVGDPHHYLHALRLHALLDANDETASA
ncbi:sugar phosphate nucleotidyltransferase [Prauserella flavalba]|uniref:sugar phosphate nucleotidyltransferase n=1 Tax=Prauserella flavalba TaxID=1477506 RepID=UPI0036EE25B6